MLLEPALARRGIRFAVPHSDHDCFRQYGARYRDPVLRDGIIFPLHLHRAADPEIVLARHVTFEDTACRRFAFDIQVERNFGPLIAGKMTLDFPRIRRPRLMWRAWRAGQ